MDHSTVHRWAMKLLPLIEKTFRSHKRMVGKSWRMGRDLYQVRGQWKYLYCAVERDGNTVDFLLCAWRFFQRSMIHNEAPDTVTIDESGANLSALKAINFERDTPINIRQKKYLNNLVEQDHRAIKRRTRRMLGFKTFSWFAS